MLVAMRGGGERHMYIEPNKSEAEIREMKVRIPSDYYMKLHSLKLLTGKQISEAVTEALELYFEQESFNKRVEKEAEASNA